MNKSMKCKMLLQLYLMMTTIFVFHSSISYAEISPTIWDKLDQDTKNRCSAVKLLQMPKNDIPSKQELNNIHYCGTNDYYYGYGEVSPDYKKARFCAYELDDYHILAMIYANGYGVRQDPDLALHYVCLIDGSPAEIVGRVEALNNLKNKKSKKNFELCDYVTSHDETLRCADLEYESAMHDEKTFIKKITINYTEKELILLKKVQARIHDFAETRVDNEMEHLARDTAANKMEEIINLRIKNSALLYVLSECNVSEYNERNYRLVDKILNRIYKKILTGPDGDFSYTVEGIKKTERAWIQYKNAVEALGLKRCPQINRFTWSTILTKQRLRQLKELRIEQKGVIENDKNSKLEY